MMRPWMIRVSVLALALASGMAQAKQDDLDVARLNNALDQLANDPQLGGHALAEQSIARSAVSQLAQADSDHRGYALYLAERRVDVAKTAAQLQVAQSQVYALDREHDRIELDGLRADADQARRELERQRLQYQLAQEEAQRSQAEGAAATAQALAQAEQARKLAVAQGRMANAAKREAALAAAAARLMRKQMQHDTAPAADGKSAGKP